MSSTLSWALVPPTSLALSGAAGGGAKKRLVAPSLSLTLSHDGFSAAALSGTPDDMLSLDINLEALETPSDSETGTLPDSTHELEWDGEMSATRALTEFFFVGFFVVVFCFFVTVLYLLWLFLHFVSRLSRRLSLCRHVSVSKLHKFRDVEMRIVCRARD